MPIRTLRAAVIVPLLAGSAGAAPCCDAASPYRAGEGMAETPADCASLQGWIDAMPALDGRVSMTVTGELATVDADEALAYLILCPEGGAQVMCVTYQTLGMVPGEQVTVAGGVVPAGEGRVMLDPCLAYRDDGGAEDPSGTEPAEPG